MKTRNSEVLTDFIAYCLLHPDERFWQALLNWSGFNFIYVSPKSEDTKYGRTPEKVYRDTFYFEGKDK